MLRVYPRGTPLSRGPSSCRLLVHRTGHISEASPDRSGARSPLRVRLGETSGSREPLRGEPSRRGAGAESCPRRSTSPPARPTPSATGSLPRTSQIASRRIPNRELLVSKDQSAVDKPANSYAGKRLAIRQLGYLLCYISANYISACNQTSLPFVVANSGKIPTTPKTMNSKSIMSDSECSPRAK